MTAHNPSGRSQQERVDALTAQPLWAQLNKYQQRKLRGFVRSQSKTEPLARLLSVEESTGSVRVSVPAYFTSGHLYAAKGWSVTQQGQTRWG